MATLSLQQKTELINNNKFQQRIIAATKEHARYWLDTEVDTYNKYNEELKKKKAFARQVIKQGVGVDFISEFATSHNGDIPGADLENSELPFDVNTNQFSDYYLNNNTPLVLTFAKYAGVEPGDSTKQVII